MRLSAAASPRLGAARLACAGEASGAAELAERLVLSEEVEVVDTASSSFAAYLAEEMPREGRPRSARAVLLLPGAQGYRCEKTRRLADRLAVRHARGDFERTSL